MKVIVTAGGTSEKIDSVRSITNSATGRLGSLVAEGFLRKLPEDGNKVYYLCPDSAVRPKKSDRRLEIVPVCDTDSLQEQIRRIMSENRIDAVVHSMAVSDYKTFHVTTADSLAHDICEKCFQTCIDKEKLYDTVRKSILESQIDNKSKISSDIEHPIIVLGKTPKIIGMVKDLNPNTVLVGFKLLSGVSREILVETAWRLLLKNKCDFVLANDTSSISSNRHDGILIDENKNCTQVSGKEAIAAAIVNAVLCKTGVLK